MWSRLFSSFFIVRPCTYRCSATLALLSVKYKQKGIRIWKFFFCIGLESYQKGLQLQAIILYYLNVHFYSWYTSFIYFDIGTRTRSPSRRKDDFLDWEKEIRWKCFDCVHVYFEYVELWTHDDFQIVAIKKGRKLIQTVQSHRKPCALANDGRCSAMCKRQWRTAAARTSHIHAWMHLIMCLMLLRRRIKPAVFAFLYLNWTSW